MKIPSNRRWTQTNDTGGVLSATRNMALDTIGQAKLAKRPVAVTSSASDGDFKYTMAIVYFDSAYTVVTSDGVFQGGLDGGVFTQTSFSPSTTLASDALIFEDTSTDQLIVTTDANFSRWNGSASSSHTLGALTSGVPHPLCIFDSNPTYKLAIGNGNQVKTYDTSYNANTTILTLPTQFQVTSLRYRNGYLYVGTKNTAGGEARVFIWSGSGANAQYEVPVGAEWVFSMTEYGSSVAVITSEGQLLQISGSQAIQLGALPVYYNPHARWQDSSGLTLNGKVFNRGMATVGNSIYINIEGNVDVGFVPEMKSGLWVFDPDVGLYHRAISTTDTLVRDSSLTVADNEITTSANHNLLTGDAVEFSSISGLSGVSTGITYYITATGSNKIKLSLSRESLVAQRYVTISGTPGGSDILVYYPNTDSGLLLSATSGAVAQTSINEIPLGMLSSEVIWGCRTKDEDGTATYVLSAFHDSNNRGSLSTQRIYSDNIQQSWKKICAFLDGLVTENDEVVIKVQTKYSPLPIELNGAWLDSNTINSNGTDLVSGWGDIQVGDELIFTDGKGQGKTAHVTNITSSASTYSVTIDEEIGVASSTVKLYRTNFSKIGVYGIDKKKNEYIEEALQDNNVSPWINIRCELRGADLAVNMFDLDNQKHN